MFKNITVENYSQLKEFIKDKNLKINFEALSKLLHSFILSIKKSLENKDNNDITWENPHLKLEYPLEMDEKTLDITFIKDENNFIEKTLEKDYIKIFNSFTNNIKIINTKNGVKHDFPENILKQIKKLNSEEQIKSINNYLKIEPLIIKAEKNKPSLSIYFNNLLFDEETNKKYFSVILSLNCENYKPSTWSEKTKIEFWDNLLNATSDFPKNNNLAFDFFNEVISIPLPNPNIKANNKKEKLIKTSLHTELQKFGKKPKTDSDTIFDIVPSPIDEETKKAIKKFQINVVGIDNTQAQNNALFAIQKLLSETNYKGNIEGKNILDDENSFKFQGYLPFMKFTATEYLDAFGVKKKKSNRGKAEYNSNERTEAIKALKDLSEKKYLLYYERKYWKDGKEVLDIIKTVRPLFNIIEGYEAIDISERDEILSDANNEKIKFIVIEPCPALVDQIDNYFILKPANCYQEIRLLVGKTSKYVHLFIDYLLTEVTKREISSKGEELNWIIEINYENLAYKLRMESFIKTKQVKRIKQNLEKCYSVAKQLGYIISSETISGKTKEYEKLILNPDKFKKVKEIDQKIKTIESKEIKYLTSSLNN